MKPFKKFYFELFSESPMNIGDTREDYSLDTIMASEKYEEILNNPQTFKKVRNADDKISVDLYEEEDGNGVICWFVPTNNTFIYGYVCYDKMPDGGITTTSVFNDKMVRFLAYKVYLYYLLKKYNYILSDKRHTGSGKRFWESLVSFTISKYKITIIDAESNQILERVKNVKDLAKYYGDSVGFEKYKIKIER